MQSAVPYGWCRLVVLLGTFVCSGGAAIAGEHACAYANIHPAFPAVDTAPLVQTSGADQAALPEGAVCFVEAERPATWITVAAVLRSAASQEDLARRFGTISQLQSVQYWSATDRAWRPMVSAAFAVDSATSAAPRANFSAAELLGHARFYRVADTRTYDPINYSLEVRPSPHGHLVVATANVDPIKKWGITLYRPEGIQTLYILSERSAGVWTYYSITRVVPATFLAAGHEKSYINRAVALYRHYMQLPTATEPPAAR